MTTTAPVGANIHWCAPYLHGGKYVSAQFIIHTMTTSGGETIMAARSWSCCRAHVARALDELLAAGYVQYRIIAVNRNRGE